jgi:ABC-2 type transport system ATP-binding protein
VDSDELEKRLRRRLVVDTLDQAAAEMVLSRAGLAPLRDDTGRIEIEDRRAIEHPERIAELLVRAGVPPTLLQTRQEDLETHFLRLVGDGGRHDGGIGRRAVG